MSGELGPVILARELHRHPRDFGGEWQPHFYVGRRGPRLRCEQCGAVYENGVSKAFERGEPDAVPPMIHHAYPTSMNEGGSGYNHNAYQSAKRAWETVFCRGLEGAELPRPLGRVLVEGEWTFPQRYGQGPDQENYRYPVSKFFGDALQLGGWLANDNWPAFCFGNAEYRLEPGVRRLRLILFPMTVELFEAGAVAA